MNQTTNKAADHAIAQGLPGADGSACVVEMTVRQQLDEFVADIDKHLAKQRAALAAEEASAEIKRALCAALPAALPLAPKKLAVGQNVYKADAEMTFVIDNEDQVLLLLQALPAVPAVLVSGGTSTFMAAERFVEDARGTKVQPIGEVVYRLCSWVGHNREEFTWWTHLAGKLVGVQAMTREGAATRARVRGHSTPCGTDEVSTVWTYENLPHGQLTRWYGGDASRMAPMTVHLLPGVTLSDALSVSQTATAKVVSSRCSC